MSCVNGNEYHDGTGDDFGCRVKSIGFLQAPYGKKHLGSTNPNMNSWEKGRVRDERGMPLLTNKNGVLQEVTVKEYAEKRSHYEAARRRLKNS